jgi:uncharacterized protein YlxW (UPF0749 family)
MEKDLEVIEKSLRASEEMIKEEAAKQPLIEKSVNELGAEVTKLEEKIATLETKQKALQAKTAGIAVISFSIGSIGGIGV